MPMNELRAIATLAKAVKLGSIRRAAAAQGVTPQAASQALAQLEARLGTRLLHRTTRQLAPTDAGQRFLESAGPAVVALQRALEDAREATDLIAGPLRIVGPRSGFAPVLVPLLAEFCRRHPAVQPDVQLDDDRTDWVAERVDVGFRIGGSADEGMIARRLFALQLIVCAAPAYLERHGTPRTPDELAAHRCSGFRHPATGQVVPWYLDIDGEIVHHAVVPALLSNDAEFELEATLAGEVVAQLANVSAAAHLRAGRLVPLLLPHLSRHKSVHLWYASRTAQPRRARAFIDLAIERLADTPAFVLGAKELRQAAARSAAAARGARP